MGKGVRLDNAIIERKLCSSRTEAQELIKKGVVFVDSVCVTKVTKQVTDSNIIDVRGKRTFVSRGGEKLLGVLQDIYISEESIKTHLHNTLVVDVGSSTGGFTDCLLQYGCKHVDAIDVGTSQMHESLRNNSQISLYENQDIRTFTTKNLYDIVVVDVSFISVLDILDSLFELGTVNKTEYYILIKPQFEVGKGNTKKGIVKDNELVSTVLEIIQSKVIGLGLKDSKIFPSHIQGGDGNQEYFLYAKK